MTLEHEAAVNELTIRALDATEHPDKAVSLLMTSAMGILQRRFGAELAVEYMTAALDAAADDDELPEPIVMACLDGMVLKQNLASAGRINGRSRAGNRR